ncbi:MAG: ATP synthase F1 subunit delta [Acidimicrobiia bacterium]|nr:ATP synthase F1 subunit delta [Acidimicrobiia bacterium]
MSAITAYARAMLSVAEADGKLEQVTDELFRFGRALESSDELLMTLSDRGIEAGRRQQIVEDLLASGASATTVGLVSMAVGAGRARELPDMITEMIRLGASSRNREVAMVRSAIPLSDDQQQRLANALAEATGNDVDVLVTVDPSVVGGIVTTIGDTVIDGTVRGRLAQLREVF